MTIFGTGLLKENATSCIPCTPQEEMHIITELTKDAESNLNEGNLYYVISNSWFAKWQKYVGHGVKEPISMNYMDIVPSEYEAKPGPINNSDIILANGSYESDKFELRRHLVEGHDYVLVPQVVWKKLHSWYNGGPELPRKMISQGQFHINYSVEVYPLCLTLIDSRDNSTLLIRLGRKATLLELYEKVSEVKRISKEKVHIWDYFNKHKHSVLTASDKTLEQCNLQMDQDILMEVNEEGNWSPSYENGSRDNELAIIPVEPLRSSLTIAGGPTASNGCSTTGCSSNTLQGNRTLAPSFTEMDDVVTAMKKGDKGGLAGLQNLGNTCFMNSAIQCLVHTPPLLAYFLKDYTEEINRHNPLGMHGELAVAFGELLRRLWSSGRMSIAPRVFKGKLARFAPQFSGYNQHDSQELLAFLLDGLHEDLNRVKQKPYIEIKDYDGLPDEEVAVECWRNHKARNDSIIVDMCQGQYKSTLVCPVCGKISITFDPFMYLSLPLPSTLTRSMTVTVIYGDGSALPMPYTVSVPKHGCCRDLSLALATSCCLSSHEDLLLAEIFNNNIYRYLENPLDPISSVKDDEHIVAYRLPKVVAREGVTKIELVHRYAVGERKYFGTPLVTFIPLPQTGSDVLAVVRMMLSPLRRATFRSPVMENGGLVQKKHGDDKAEEGCSTGRGEEGRERDVKLTVETEEKGGNFRALEKTTTVVKPCRVMKVGVVWGRKEEEMYDSDYLKDLPEVHKNGFPAKKTRQEVISLFSCVDAFLKEEPLGPDDMWYCPRCKEHRQARKKLDLWRLPEVLVFHLKRFSYSRFMKNKLDTFVNFPISVLDLTNYVKSSSGSIPHVYELYAVSNHYGGLGGGHYSAYAKLVDGDNQWYHFDDTHVSAVSEEGDVRTSAAYVLFYQRVGNIRGQGGDEDVDME